MHGQLLRPPSEPDPGALGPQAALVCALLAAGLSISTCTVVIYRLHGLHPRLRARLLARQLWWLALADIAVALDAAFWPMKINHVPVASLLPVWHDAPLVGECFREHYLSSVVELASSLFEVHIAVGWACSWLRWHGTLVKLDQCLSYTSILAAFLGLINYATARRHYDDDRGGICVADGKEYVQLFVLFASVVICFSACGVSLYCASFSSESALGPVLRRAWMYPASFLVSSGPFCYALLTGQWFDAVGRLAFILLGLTGFFNALTYFVQTKYAKASVMNDLRLSINLGSSVISGSASPARQRIAQTDVVSFHAIFASEVEILEVPRVQREALQRSERDTQQLQGTSLSSVHAPAFDSVP